MRTNNFKLDLVNDNIPKLIKTIAIPASIGFFFQTMYNVVDTFYAGLISTDALAAMTLCFPLFIIILALGNGVGIGASALVANSLGAKQKKLAKKYVSQSLSYGLIITVLITILGLKFSTPLFVFLGATSEVLVLANEYAVVLFSGAIFFVLNHIFNAILMAKGDTKSFRNVLVVGFFLNIILDPLFLFGWFGLPKMGLTGIALATIIIQGLSAVYLLIRVMNSGLFNFKEFIQNFKPQQKLYADISKQGLPASFNHLMMAVGIFIITYYVGTFGTMAVAAIGISMRVEQIALLPAIGLNMAALSLVGQNNGAKNYTRVKEAVNYCMKYGAIFILMMSILIFIFAKYILGMFTSDPQVLEIALNATRIAASYIVAYVIFGISVSSLQAMKKPYFALWTSLIRQLIGPLIFFPLLAYVLNLGINGIFWSMFIIAWMLAIISLIYVNYIFSKLPQDNVL